MFGLEATNPARRKGEARADESSAALKFSLKDESSARFGASFRRPKNRLKEIG